MLSSCGADADCKPTPPRYAKEGPIQWAYFPEFSWLRLVIIICWFVFAVGLIVVALGAASRKPGLTFFGVVLLISGLVMVCVFLNWKWNQDKQEAFMIARYKGKEAAALWEAVDDKFAFQAKDTFFETKYGGKTLRVLRDGSIEVYGTHRDIETGEIMESFQKVSEKGCEGVAGDAADAGDC